MRIVPGFAENLKVVAKDEIWRSWQRLDCAGALVPHSAKIRDHLLPRCLALASGPYH
jgi:hypothetical protein